MDNHISITENPLAILERRLIRNENLLLEVLQLLKKQESDSIEKLVSGDEARKMFYPKISISTLYRWSKDGLITKKRIGGKVLYSKTEIEKAAKTIKSYKQKSPIKIELGLQ